MPVWLQITLAVAGIVVAPFVAHMAAKRGAQRGLEIALAVHDATIAMLKDEVVKLRQAKHDHAGFLTQHEMRIEMLERGDRGRDQR